MQLQKCTMRDVSKLALLNKQLIDDEKSDNAMNINELERRMKKFLKERIEGGANEKAALTLLMEYRKIT